MSTSVNATPGTTHGQYSCREVPVTVDWSCFRGTTGVAEWHLVARPTAYAPATTQLTWLQRGYHVALAALNLPADSAVLRRFFCSDIANQAALLRTDPLAGPGAVCAVSRVGQPPVPPAKIAVWAVHLHDPAGGLDKHIEGNTLALRRGDLHHYWTCGLADAQRAAVADQTRAVFADYEAVLRRHDLTLADNVLRTWLFVRDIDRDYDELVAARRAHFAERGLTPDTHYIVSTGIAGAGVAPDTHVTLDAYAIGGLDPQQVTYINAPANLGPTDAYGVTFERAATIAYRDRTHVLVAGTASIDPAGHVLHAGDAARQLDRTLDNIAALLTAAGARPADLTILIAYVRDAADASTVAAGIQRRVGSVPTALVTARVCRPAWLVEVEAQAIIPGSRADLARF
jgi:enamine deaminase RidA (YjgF/YER057c/UK114 family)